MVLPFTKGKSYKIIFVPEHESSGALKIYDWNEQWIATETMSSTDDKKAIVMDYVPPVTEYHLIKFAQMVEPSRSLSGYLMFFMKN